MPVDPVMQMGRSAACISRVAGIADNVARLYTITFTECGVAIQVRVVVPLETWSENPDHLAAESIRADTRHDSARRAQHRCVFRREDVDAFMPPATRPRVAPRVDEPPGALRRQRTGKHGCWFLEGQRGDEPCAFNDRPGCHGNQTYSDSHKDPARKQFHGRFSLRHMSEDRELSVPDKVVARTFYCGRGTSSPDSPNRLVSGGFGA
jgi:hypothetical protein